MSADVLVSTLQELMPGYNETFTKNHPVLGACIKNGGIERLDAPFKQWTLTPGDPGRFNKIVTGAEPLNGGRLMNSRRVHAFPAMHIYVVDVPLQDLRKSRGKTDMANLVETYPERSILGIHEKLASQLVMGLQDDLDGIFTFNGEQSYTPENIVNQGFIEFAAPSAQTGTVFGLARNGIAGWHNQYRRMSSMSSDGLQTLRDAFWDCTEEGSASYGAPDVLLADRASFSNYLNETGDFVVVNDKDGVDHATRDIIRDFVPFGKTKAKMYSEPAIKIGDFTGDAADGVVYIIHSPSLGLFKTTTGDEKDGKSTTDQLLTMRDKGVLPYHDAYRLEFLLPLGAMLKQLRFMGAVTGGAIA